MSQSLIPFAGNGQIVRSGAISRGFIVQAVDAVGNPIPAAVVNWVVTSGIGPTLAIAQATTDREGKAATLFVAETLAPGQRIKIVKMTASTTIQGMAKSFEFTAVILALTVNVSAEASTILNAANPVGAGTTLPNAVTAQVFSNASGVVEPLSGVGLFADPDGVDGPLATCANTTLSDADGRVSCNLVAGARLATGAVRISVGGQSENSFLSWRYPLRVVGGPPATLTVIQGDGQSGVSGDLIPRAMVVEGRDVFGNLSDLVEVSWSVLSGSAQLTGISGKFDREGRASALVRFGEIGGPVVVEARYGTATARFNLRNETIPGTFTLVSGSGQSAVVLTPFSQPLLVRALNGRAQPVAGATVTFSVISGEVTLSSLTAVTDGQGQASITATAGNSAGPATVQAALGLSRVTFNLSITGILPKFDTLVNAVSLAPGSSPCSLAILRGSGLVPALRGLDVAAPWGGRLPTTYRGVTVRIGNTLAPILWVSSNEAGDQVAIQIPCESPTGTVPVALTAAGQTVSGQASVFDVLPGILETPDWDTPENPRRHGVVTRPDGSFVSARNPAVVGETVTGFFVGLGATTETRSTGVNGAGQTTPADRVVIGVNNQGMAVESAVYAAGRIGIYQVRFTIDPAAGSGNVPYAMAVRDGNGNLVFANSSVIAVKQ